MTPSDTRLLEGLRSAVNEVVQLQQDDQCLSLLHCIDVVLDELIKRQGFAFHSRYFTGGRSLFDEGVNQIVEKIPPNSGLLAVILDQYRILPDRLDPSWNSARIGAAEQGITDSLAQLITMADQMGIDLGGDYLARVVNWEVSLHEFRANALTPSAPGQTSAMDLDRDALIRYFQEKFPDKESVDLRGCRVIPGGFSKTTIDVEVAMEKGEAINCILRVEQPARLIHLDGSYLVNEFPVVQLAFDAGIPVARPLWLETDLRFLGAPFMVSMKAPGTTTGSAVGALNEQLSERMLYDIAEVLARIHNMPLKPDDPRITQSHLGKWINYRTLNELYPVNADYWHNQAELSDIADSPAIARAYSWLKRYPPSCDQPPALLHGDYGLHNILMHGGRISAVLDWEGAQLGDPADEFFILTNALKSHYSPEQVLRFYNEAGGREISEYRLRYSEVLFSMKALIIGYAALRAFEANPDTNFKMCYVGLRHMFPGLLNESISRAECART